MHDIEPHFRWRDFYIASSDRLSPFYGRTYSEFECTNSLYNFYIHPQWDAFGSSTLYTKILFVDYEEGFALLEMMGEWNDTLHNDIMFLKRNVAEPLMRQGVSKFVFFCENVFNFHASTDDDYYAEWAEELREEGGWIALLNTRTHVEEEMEAGRLSLYTYFGDEFNHIVWRTLKPPAVLTLLETVLQGMSKRLYY